jgi:hypothetical protein
MTEILFYHLQGQKLEGVLTPLLEKSLERGWKVAVQGATEERIDALDAHLWTYRDDGFLPVIRTRQRSAFSSKAPRCRPTPRAISAWCWYLTATTMTRSPPRGRSGPTPKPGVSRRPIGSPTTRAAG